MTDPAPLPLQPAVPPRPGHQDVEPLTGLELQAERRVPRKQVWAWAIWDWATQPFNSVILTFVFTALYLTSDWFLDPAVAELGEGDPAYERAIADLASGLGWAITVAGILIAVLAPVLGQRADVAGRRKLWLGGATAALVACMFALFFVQGSPPYFLLGISLIAAGTVFSEIAGVNYNAMLVQVSTPRTVGKVSGLGWGLGYLGGIVALVLVVVATTFDWWGMPTDDGLVYRVIAVGCAVWTLVFAWPVLVYVPEAPPAPGRERVGFFRSYAVLVRDIARLWREARPTFWFLLASAVFRDGLAGVFAFGAVIAAVVFRFTSNEVMLFGIAANLLAGVSTIVAGRFDDRFGPRAVILTALGGLVGAGLIVFFLHDAGKVPFWIFGLVLTLFVGPAQAASRSFLARVTPAGRESEIFGLYATTGRAASFLSPMLWSGFIVVFGATYWGILGIVLVLIAGLVLMLFVRVPKRVAEAAAAPIGGR
ncbi:MFS transporter [Agromyces aurantiacus]|uniref:MFS transporter n=1 Tax=Agromyces aurantiacus TaxID=165814 RepID=A0ABV9R358_9MICO|nr:MFS transporter [Agromyces aurantiacus]MBM7502702.1 UMF1 family MFS transporter [Agromyces aurantiacus]